MASHNIKLNHATRFRSTFSIISRRGKWLLIVVVLSLVLLDSTPAWSTEDSIQIATELNKEFISLSQQGKYAEAIPIAERIYVILQKTLCPAHPVIAQFLSTMASLYSNLGIIRGRDTINGVELQVISIMSLDYHKCCDGQQ